MLKVLSYILSDLDPKVKVIGQKAGICDGVPSTSALVSSLFVAVVSSLSAVSSLFVTVVSSLSAVSSLFVAVVS